MFQHVIFAIVVFSELIQPSAAQEVDVYIECNEAQFESTSLCYVDEGSAADIEVRFAETESGEFEYAEYRTGADPEVEIANVDDASPILDYAPIVVVSEFQFDTIVETADDCNVERDEKFHLMANPRVASGANLRTNDGVGVVIVDDDDEFCIEKEYYEVSETGGSVTFKAKRDPNGVLAQRTLEYSTSDMSATSGLDYESVTGGQITFASGSTTSGDGTVDIIPDLDTAESDEMFAINLVFNDPSAPSGCSGKIIHPSTAYVTILDTTVPVTYRIENGTYSVIEPESGTYLFTFTILKLGSTNSRSTIVYATRPVNAGSGTDFQPPSSTSATVVFNPGDDREVATVIINSDDITEGPETFEVSIGSPSIGTVESQYKATVTIQDIATTRSCVRFDSSVYVVLESSETVTLILQREGNLSRSGDITIATEDIDATDSNDYVAKTETITFQMYEVEKMVTINIRDDMIKEDAETFKVKLQSVLSSSLDACTPETNVQIKNDDDAISVEGTVFRVHEDERSIEINIKRCGYLGKSSTVRIAHATPSTEFPNSAELGADFTLPSPSTVEFAPNQRRGSVVIGITSENPPAYEGDEEFTVILEPSSASQQDQIGLPDRATIVIVDQFRCNLPCLNGGSCIGNNVCKCTSRYTGNRCQTEIREFVSDFTIVNEVFGPDLNDENSPRYIALRSTIEEQLNRAFSSLQGYRSTQVLYFSPGSVKVGYRVAVDSDSNSNIADVSQMFEQIVNNDLTLGSTGLQLQQTDINCPVNYCENGGTCVQGSTMYYCQCLAGFTGTTCLTAPPITPESPTDDNGLSAGSIAGIILGILAAILILALIGICFLRLNNQRTQRAAPPPQQQQIDLRPYNGVNPIYLKSDGVLGVPPLY